MRARMFFAVLKEARRMHIEEKNHFLVDLVNVSVAGLGGKCYEEGLEYFRSRLQPAHKKKAFDASDENSARILSSMLRPARVLAGGA